MKYLKRMDEVIKIPIKVGDTVLGGRFKNKKIKVKKIGKNKKGDVTINGKPLLKFRIIKESDTYSEDVDFEIDVPNEIDSEVTFISLVDDNSDAYGHIKLGPNEPHVHFYLLEPETYDWYGEIHNTSTTLEALKAIEQETKINNSFIELFKSFPHGNFEKSPYGEYYFNVPFRHFGRSTRRKLEAFL